MPSKTDLTPADFKKVIFRLNDIGMENNYSATVYFPSPSAAKPSKNEDLLGQIIKDRLLSYGYKVTNNINSEHVALDSKLSITEDGSNDKGLMLGFIVSENNPKHKHINFQKISKKLQKDLANITQQQIDESAEHLATRKIAAGAGKDVIINNLAAFSADESALANYAKIKLPSDAKRVINA